jgi:methionyl-tRNA formyltransferase
VVAIGEDGVDVACADGRVRIQRVRPAGGAKMPAGEWAVASGVGIGAGML